METLRLMVKSILVIILMTAFLEIVLPRSDIKRYINLIIGLFVIVAILNPILALVNKDFDFEVLSRVPDSSTQDTGELISRGKELARSRDNRVAAEYRDKLENQIKSLSGLYQDAEIKDVTVDMVDDTAEPDFGKINKIIIRVEDTGASGSTTDSETDSITDSAADRKAGNEEIMTDIDDINVDVEVNIPAPGVDAGGAGTSKELEGSGPNEELQQMVADFYGLSSEQIEVRE